MKGTGRAILYGAVTFLVCFLLCNFYYLRTYTEVAYDKADIVSQLQLVNYYVDESGSLISTSNDPNVILNFAEAMDIDHVLVSVSDMSEDYNYSEAYILQDGNWGTPLTFQILRGENKVQIGVKGITELRLDLCSAGLESMTVDSIVVNARETFLMRSFIIACIFGALVLFIALIIGGPDTCGAWFRTHRLSSGVAIAIWILMDLSGMDRAFFTYEEVNRTHNIVRVLHLIALLLICNLIAYLIRNFRENEAIRRGLQIFVFYFALMIILWIMLYPGTWSLDDIYVADNLQNYRANGWHHIITEYYQMTLLQFLPFLGGMILLQNALIAGIVAYVITRVETLFLGNVRLKWTCLDLLVKCLPFLMPPVLLYQFSGYRMGIYVYVELLLLVMLLCFLKEDGQVSMTSLFALAILTAIVACWRSEAIFYVLLTPAIILFTRRERIPWLKKGLCIAVLFICFFLIRSEEDYTLELRAYGHDYDMLATIRPAVELIRSADMNDSDDAVLVETMGHVVKLNMIDRYPSVDGENLFRMEDGLTYSDYSDSDYKAYMKAFVKLCLRHPEVVLRERWANARNILGLNGKMDGLESNILGRSLLLFEETEVEPIPTFQEEDWILQGPISAGLRNATILFLGCCDSGKNALPIFYFFWNSAIPICFMIITWVVLLIRKRFGYALVYFFALLKVPLIILAAPSAFFFYMLSAYLIGWSSLLFGLLWYNKRNA